MAYNCNQCTEVTTAGEIISTVTKVAMFAGVVYLVFNFRNDLKEIVASGIKKTKSSLNGTKKKSKK
jgi:hypothetical protein